ncbi:MAG: iron-containing alcohol dehydrogenase [Eubacteriales bacterium]
MSREFTMPQKIITGENALKNSGAIFREAGKKAFIVTGKHVVNLDFFKTLTDTLEAVGVGYTVFSGITGEPTDTMIEAGLAEYQCSGCDFFIGIGGGSPLDSIKAIGVLAVLGGNIADFMGQNIQAKLPPMIAIPTTAGTGSETTKFTIITDLKNDVKMLLKGENLVPNMAIIDPEASVSSPKSVTAATGLDALTHAVESYTSKMAQPLTDTVALSAVQRIFKYLPRAYADGTDMEARTEMAIAAFEAGIAINNASVTVVHGMSRPIGALFHVPHGISNAMLLPTCMAFAAGGAVKKFADLGRAIGANTDNDAMAATIFIDELKRICKVCEVPTLVQYGIDRADFVAKIDKMATDALASGSPGNTIKAVTQEDIVNLYHEII